MRIGTGADDHAVAALNAQRPAAAWHHLANLAFDGDDPAPARGRAYAAGIGRVCEQAPEKGRPCRDNPLRQVGEIHPRIVRVRNAPSIVAATKGSTLVVSEKSDATRGPGLQRA